MNSTAISQNIYRIRHKQDIMSFNNKIGLLVLIFMMMYLLYRHARARKNYLRK
jgi:hypothetical protein